LTKGDPDNYFKIRRLKMLRKEGNTMMKNDVGLAGLFAGLLVGGAFGAAAGLLFAPKAGKELRAEVGEKGCELLGDAKEMVSDTQEKAKTIIEEARHAADELRKEAERRLSEAHRKACMVLSCGEPAEREGTRARA
jgi:gas vesicle protein